MEEKETGNQEAPIEENLKELDGIVEKLESRDISLEESFTLYQKGMELLKQCSSKIDRVEKKMLKINEDGELSEF
ncbi:MAG TPA: exodeoxyribonuclease VII small subunit [Candidatus Blautia stercoripullorum]|uniref:Exodeoxyribonuclease 7 small subunit n=1 Tax=Candidatus Blautia stercoripullorum TaxID=2838502 RepID=A0A9D2RCM0_9FIRM|nr:exodeoxyribonuclease VII small subunit [Candidatus Blautia stercoripullorum]